MGQDFLDPFRRYPPGSHVRISVKDMPWFLEFSAAVLALVEEAEQSFASTPSARDAAGEVRRIGAGLWPETADEDEYDVPDTIPEDW